MKKILCALLALLLLTGAGLAEASGNLLGLRLLAGMTDGTQNAAISPLSLQMALSLAREGAAGETRAELDALLAGDEINLEALLANARYADSYAWEGADAVAPGLQYANAAFVAPGVEILPEYKARVDAEWFPLDEDVETINAWARENTNSLIDKLLENPLPPDMALCLVNALSLEAKWEQQFLEEDTYSGAFFAPEGETEADFMYAESDFLYGERDGAQLACLPYEGTTLAMYVILPEVGGVPAALEALAREGTAYFADMNYDSEVHLSLPKFSLSYGGSLMDGLKAQGMQIATGADADFSAMCANAPLYISNVIQNVRIDVDEKGTSAAAVTALWMCGAAMPEEEPEFVEMKVNRPFIIVIADLDSKAIAFAAVVAEV